MVSFDHLHAGFLGCCGNDWIETPNLDRLATEGVVFDQHFCENIDPTAANHAWWTGQYQFALDENRQLEGRPFVNDLLARGVRTCLIVEADGRDDSAIAPPFAEVLEVRGSDGFDVLEAETPFARVVKRSTDWLHESDSHSEPALLWIKSRGVPAPWVPPQAFAELYLDEFGLADDSGGETASDETSDVEDPAAVVPEEEGSHSESDGSLDWRYAAAMYAAYTTLIDRWLGKLLATLTMSQGWNEALVIVTAGAGQSLGEHGRLADENLQLRSESVQTPLWIRVPGSDQMCTRRQDLVQTVDLAPTLLEWFCEGHPASFKAEPPPASVAGRSLLPLVRQEQVAPRDSIVMGNGRREWGIRTRNFFYVEAGDQNQDSEHSPARLYEKPHDRWDQSDVLAQYPQVAEDLQAALASPTSAMHS